MRLFLIVFVVLSLCGGCGYRLQQDEVHLDLGGGKTLAQPKVFVPVFDNVTAYAGAEIPLTRAVRNELQSQRGVRVVNQKKDADVVLLGKIVGFERKRDEASTLQGNQESEDAGGVAATQLVAAALTVDVSVDLTMIYPDPQLEADRVLWIRNYARSVTFRSSDRLAIRETSTAAPYVNRSREQLSLRGLSEQVAKEIVDQVKQDF